MKSDMSKSVLRRLAVQDPARLLEVIEDLRDRLAKAEKVVEACRWVEPWYIEGNPTHLGKELAEGFEAIKEALRCHDEGREEGK